MKEDLDRFKREGVREESSSVGEWSIKIMRTENKGMVQGRERKRY
jgi:hypothetical protein